MIDDGKLILDACCGARMFWFDKKHPNAVYIDIRETDDNIPLCPERPNFKIKPDVIGDFTNMPFDDCSFNLVVWDPPHIVSMNKNSRMTKKYGCLNPDAWESTLKKGFDECMRVLKPNGVLIFKWAETTRSVSQVINLFPVKPLFGHPTSKSGKTHWFTYMKIDTSHIVNYANVKESEEQ